MPALASAMNISNCSIAGLRPLIRVMWLVPLNKTRSALQYLPTTSAIQAWGRFGHCLDSINLVPKYRPWVLNITRLLVKSVVARFSRDTTAELTRMIRLLWYIWLLPAWWGWAWVTAPDKTPFGFNSIPWDEDSLNGSYRFNTKVSTS